MVGTPPDITIWHHVAVTFDGSIAKTYINGNLTSTNTVTNAYHAGDKLSLGSYYGKSTWSTHYMQDVRIYDHCLSAAEVHEISQGLVLHYKLDSQYSESTINLITSIGQCSRMTINNNQAYIDWSVNAGDTYIFFNTSEAMSTSNIYSFSFQCEGLSSSEENTISFGWANLGGNYRIFIHNGWNKLENFSPPSNELRTFFDDYNRNTTAKFKLYDFQLEKKDHATGFVGYGVSNVGIIQDSSGYGHNGTINGTLTLSNNTPRYSSAIYGGNNTTSVVTTWDPSWLNSNQTFTCNVWINKKSQVGSDWNTIFRYANSNVKSQQLHFCYKASSILLSRYSDDISISYTIPTDQWIMLTWTGSGRSESLYINGEFKQTVTHSTDLALVSTAKLMLFKDAVRNNYGSDIMMSDFRIYCTALSADDILSLYHTAAKVDNLGGLHTFELNEFGSNKLTKTGIFKDYMIEPFITLSDGSKWQMLMFHYVDGGNNLFKSTNAAYCNDFGLYSRLQYIDNFTYDGKYEFYAIQDGTPHRWTQTNAPLTTTSVANFTVISGSPGGGICKCNSNTLLARTNTTSNWWDACGCWTKYSTGIPGFNGDCKYYLVLYARISEPKFHIANLTAYANNLIEK